MKKINLKVLSVLISIVLTLSGVSFIDCFGAGSESANILYNLKPIIFGSADEGTYTLNQNTVRFEKSGTANVMGGYDNKSITTQRFWAEKLHSMTDGDESTGQYLRPYRSADNDRLIMVFRFPESELEELKFVFDTVSTDVINALVFTSQNLDSLFSGDAVYEISKGKNTTYAIDMKNSKACYLGIVFDKITYKIAEIELTGSEIPKESNVLSGLKPVAYMGVSNDSVNYSENRIYYNSTDSEKGYTDSGQTADTKAFWDSQTQFLTDGDFSSGMFMKPVAAENNKRILMVYELPDAYNLSDISITTQNKTKNITVYVSRDRNLLFNGNPVSISLFNSGSMVKDHFEDITARYIGLIFEEPDYSVYDISVFGKPVTQKEKGENILKGKTPALFGSSNFDKFEYNWTQTYYSPTEMKWGYGEGSDMKQHYSFWQEKLALLTDENTDTSLYVRPERASDKIVFVYNLDDCIINGFSLSTKSDLRKKIKVYADIERTTLFEAKSLIFESDSNAQTITDFGDIEKRAKYVGIVLETSGYEIDEIILNATPYVRPDYGTNLVSGRTPVRLFLANRSYPLVSTGDQWINRNDIAKLMGNMNDDDFTTDVSLRPTKPLEKVNEKSRYIVLVYDLGDRATLNKFLIDSNIGGFDLYVSDNYMDVFSDDPVYTTNGDKKLSNGQLDPSTNLAPGEQMADFGGVRGRYVGIVITRIRPTNELSYEIATIREIQIFGEADQNTFGNNLIAKKKPIMTYRANYGDYANSLGNMTTKGDMAAYTDGDISTSAEIQFPGVGGYISYDCGVLVMIYYLEGTSQINYFSVDTPLWYGIGGVDVYAATTFKSLFDNESRIFTSEGDAATDKVYDPSKNLGALRICDYFDQPATGRYVAFVFTRICDSNVQGWTSLRLLELSVLGQRNEVEVLPNTTLTDSSSGSTATFEYDNPDEKFEFAAKGITGFKLDYIPEKDYLTDIFTYSLAANGLSVKQGAFTLQFYDSSGTPVSKSLLAGEKITLNLKLPDSSKSYLCEIRDNVAYVIKNAEQDRDTIKLLVEDFDKVFILMDVNMEGVKLKNLSDGSIVYNETYDFDIDDDYEYDYDFEDDIVSEEPSENIDKNTPKKSTKKWVVVKLEDPYEWFWNIYDTFAANIWMLIVCISVLCVSVGSVVYGFVHYRVTSKTR